MCAKCHISFGPLGHFSRNYCPVITSKAAAETLPRELRPHRRNSPALLLSDEAKRTTERLLPPQENVVLQTISLSRHNKQKMFGIQHTPATHQHPLLHLSQYPARGDTASPACFHPLKKWKPLKTKNKMKKNQTPRRWVTQQMRGEGLAKVITQACRLVGNNSRAHSNAPELTQPCTFKTRKNRDKRWGRSILQHLYLPTLY